MKRNHLFWLFDFMCCLFSFTDDVIFVYLDFLINIFALFLNEKVILGFFSFKASFDVRKIAFGLFFFDFDLIKFLFLLELIFSNELLNLRIKKERYMGFVFFVVLFDCIDFFERRFDRFGFALIFDTFILKDIKFVFQDRLLSLTLFVFLNDIMLVETRSSASQIRLGLLEKRRH